MDGRNETGGKEWAGMRKVEGQENGEGKGGRGG
jgi:hypothetical protein